MYKYFPQPEGREFIVQFIKKGKLLFPPVEPIHDTSLSAVDLHSERIVGGHTFITSFKVHMVGKPVQLSDKLLFLEHHNSQGEDIHELLYYFQQIKLLMKKHIGLPKALLLGHSLLCDEEGKSIDWKEINVEVANIFHEFDIPVFQIDSINAIIPFKNSVGTQNLASKHPHYTKKIIHCAK